MRPLRRAAVLAASLITGSMGAQVPGSVSDYNARPNPAVPAQTIYQTAAPSPSALARPAVPAFLPPPPASPLPAAEGTGVVFQPAPATPAPVYMPTPARPPLPTAGGPLYEPTGQASGWVRGEALLWWMNGKSLPPIFSTSPAGTPQAQAGVLGTPGAQVVFGGNDPLDDPRWGGRVTAGLWLEGAKGVVGLEGSYFRLASKSATAAVGGDGITSRPFVNPDGTNDAELVSFPGVLAGTATATLDATTLSGANGLVRVPFCYDPCNPRPRLDLLVGYQWLHYGEDFGVREDLFPTGAAFVPGTSIVVLDRFRVRDDFHGATVGLAYGGRVGALTLDLTGRASVGHLSRKVDVSGSTTVTQPGATPVTAAGGLLTQTSNIGSYDDGTWTVVPEADLRVGYDVSPRLRLTAGYTVMVLNDFYRAAGVIDPVVNRNLIPPGGAGVGPQRPGYNPTDGPLWVHGLTFGAELRF